LLSFFFFASKNSSLADLRNVTIFILSYAGFFRINEILSFTKMDLICFDAYCEIFVKRSETDVLRDGNSVVIGRTETAMCPVKLLERYLLTTNIDCTSIDFYFQTYIFLWK
jgi:hypothetical protein